MRIYLIKCTGATIWQNLYFDRRAIFPDGEKIYLGVFFFHKKDAKAYLETLENNEFYEVVGATVDKSKTDNRKK